MLLTSAKTLVDARAYDSYPTSYFGLDLTSQQRSAFENWLGRDRLGPAPSQFTFKLFLLVRHRGYDRRRTPPMPNINSTTTKTKEVVTNLGESNIAPNYACYPVRIVARKLRQRGHFTIFSVCESSMHDGIDIITDSMHGPIAHAHQDHS